MKYYLLILLSIILFSCGKEKVIQLPEISHSEITEINDVSAAYLFYDETQKDSVELNRKNLISTTNWLVNVDKRLTLKQVIPHIKFLQDKKKNAGHKNENAKNYFTCNDKSRKDLGFIEFTDVNYKNKTIIDLHANLYLTNKNNITVYYISNKDIKIIPVFDYSHSIMRELIIRETDLSGLIGLINSRTYLEKNESSIVLAFDENILFQDYISVKHELNSLQSEVISFDSIEYLIN